LLAAPKVLGTTRRNYRQASNPNNQSKKTK